MDGIVTVITLPLTDFVTSLRSLFLLDVIVTSSALYIFSQLPLSVSVTITFSLIPVEVTVTV